MSANLSICIPIYNFGEFIPETLNSILHQDDAENVEIIVLDGASTDNTADIVADFQKTWKNIKYFRLPAKGGIDRDMAKCVEYATSDYCWLFSGDDIMHAGALRKALDEIKSGHDLYLCKHMEYRIDLSQWVEWPTVNSPRDAVFELSDKKSRLKYFRAAVNTEAFFSFMGGLLVKRATWDRIPLNEDFVGSCWAHAARMFELTRGGLSVKCLAEPYLDRRPDNDSFADKGMVNRFRIAIEGYHRIADTFFGHDSAEAYHVRRVIRHEFNVNMLLLGKFLCSRNPEVESKTLMDQLVRMAYSDFSYDSLRTRFLYAVTSPARFRRNSKVWCERFEKGFT